MRGVRARDEAESAFPPHPCPLPEGEGESSPARPESGGARNVAVRETALPLPRGEGWGEGETSHDFFERALPSTKLEEKAEMLSLRPHVVSGFKEIEQVRRVLGESRIPGRIGLAQVAADAGAEDLAAIADFTIGQQRIAE